MGTGDAGWNGDDLSGLDTLFYFPTGLLVHPEGGLLVVDSNNYRVRRMGEDGLVQTVAGSGVHAYAREGETALQSPLENPMDAEWGPDGLLYIAAQHEGRVLRIGEEGRVEVIAGTGEITTGGDGGSAVLAKMEEPTALAFDDEGALYIADALANRVRRIGTDGIITTVVGTGAPGPFSPRTGMEAALYQPRDLAWDVTENRLLIADTYGHAVVQWSRSTGEATWFAGTGEAGDGGEDGEAAVDVELELPQGLAVATDGTVYIADAGHHRVVTVDSAGVLEVVLGNGERGEFPQKSMKPKDLSLGYPVSLLLVEGGALYVSDWDWHAVVVWGEPSPE